MRLLEDRQLYKGVFWIVDLENIYNNSNYCFTIPSDEYGNVQPDDLYLNAKSGTTYNHEKLWNSLPRKMTQGRAFNYYPRGRVEIQNEKATIYLNPNIYTEEIVDFLVDGFNLARRNGIKVVLVHADGTEHYKCYLDRK